MIDRQHYIVNRPPQDDADLVTAIGKMSIAFGRLEDMLKIMQAHADGVDVEEFVAGCGKDKKTAHKILKNLFQSYDLAVIEELNALFSSRNDLLHSAYTSKDDGRYIRLREGEAQQDYDADIALLNEITLNAHAIIPRLAKLRPKKIKEVAAALIFDKNDKLLIYLRDDKPSIRFPNHWDLFGGMVDNGETPDEALVREVKEELGLDVPLSSYTKWKIFDCPVTDSAPNIKHVYYTKVDVLPEDLKLLDCGQRLTSITLDERHDYKFGSIHHQILDEFANANIILTHNKRLG